MSNICANSQELFKLALMIQKSVSSIEVSRQSLKTKYQQLGTSWNDKKYSELGDIVDECSSALTALLKLLLQGEKSVLLMAKSLQEYENLSLNASSNVGLQISSQSQASPQMDGTALIKSVANTWSSSLSSEETSALRDYTGTAYLNINSVLRGTDKNFAPGYYDKALRIHQALQKSSLPCSCVVYRGVSIKALGEFQHLTDQQLVGCILNDNGFMSTSLNPNDAFSGDIRLELSVPEGTHGAYMGYLSQCGHYESEVLLDMGQTMQITHVTRDFFGNRVIHARVLL